MTLKSIFLFVFSLFVLCSCGNLEDFLKQMEQQNAVSGGQGPGKPGGGNGQVSPVPVVQLRCEDPNVARVVLSDEEDNSGGPRRFEIDGRNVAIHVAGAKTQVELVVKGNKPVLVCLDITGNEAQVHIDSSAKAAVYESFVRGTKAQLQLSSRDGGLANFRRLQIRGNEAQVQLGISNGGKLLCPIADIGGTGASYQCQDK